MDPEPLTYADARRLARAILGSSADIQLLSTAAFSHRVGVVMPNGRFVIVAAGTDWRSTIEEARQRQL